MIDLQIHLDGSLTKEDVIYLADLQRITLPENWEELLSINDRCKNPREYLKYFDFPLSLLQSVDAIEYAMHSLVSRLAKSGLIYAEIRFAPALHIKKYLTQERVIKAALRGLYKGLEENPGFDANLILVCMREFGLETNMITCKHAINYSKDNKIVALDLAGNEKAKPIAFFKNVFALAKQHNLPFVVHAGEVKDCEEISKAVKMGASRISHGVNYDFSKDINYLLYSHDVTFELCPTQHIHSSNLPDYASLPLKKFTYNGIKATICSGNLTISNTDLYKEYAHVIEALNLRKEDVYTYLMNAVTASFIPVKEKGQLINRVIAHFDEFYNYIINNLI